MKIKFKKLTPTAKAPTRAYEHDAGYDLYADRYEEGLFSDDMGANYTEDELIKAFEGVK